MRKTLVIVLILILCFAFLSAYIAYWSQTNQVFKTIATAPKYSLPSPSYSSTLTGATITFSSEWINRSATAIDTVLYSDNATGSWSWNNTATLSEISDTSHWWANFTATLTGIVGAVVNYFWIANDTSNFWNTTMINQTLTTTQFTRQVLWGDQNLDDGYPSIILLANGTVYMYVTRWDNNTFLLYSSQNGINWTLVYNFGEWPDPLNRRAHFGPEGNVQWNGSMYIADWAFQNESYGVYGKEMLVTSPDLIHWTQQQQCQYSNGTYFSTNVEQGQSCIYQLANGTYIGLMQNGISDTDFCSSPNAWNWTLICTITPSMVGLTTEVEAAGSLFYNSTSNLYEFMANYGPSGSQEDAELYSSTGGSWSTLNSSLVSLPYDGYDACNNPTGFFVLNGVGYLLYGLTDSLGYSQGIAEDCWGSCNG